MIHVVLYVVSGPGTRDLIQSIPTPQKEPMTWHTHSLEGTWYTHAAFTPNSEGTWDQAYRPPPPCGQMDRPLRKHYLPATSLAGGKS